MQYIDIKERFSLCIYEVLHDLYVAHMGDNGMCTGFWWGNLKERKNLGDLSIQERIILNWILKK